MGFASELGKTAILEKVAAVVVGMVGVAFGAGVTWTTQTTRVERKADRTEVDSVRVVLLTHISESQSRDRRLQRIEEMLRVLVCEKNARDTYCRLPVREP